MSPKLRKSIILKRNDALYLCGAGIFLTGGWLVLFYALSIGDAVVVTPLSSLHPLVVLGLSYFFLKDVEKITKKIVLGAVLSVFGVVLITLG
jgi:drug/metabolite transporter (DMT)-like permease